MSRAPGDDGGDRPRGADEVGYCRPPKSHQFKKGAPSPNPFGRRGKPNVAAADGACEPDFLDGLVTILANGKRIRVTRDEAIDHVLFAEAGRGNVTAARRLDERRAERRRWAEVRQRAATSAQAGFDRAEEEVVILRALERRKAAPLAPATEVRAELDATRCEASGDASGTGGSRD